MSIEQYILDIGQEILQYLLKNGAKREDAEDIIQNTFYKIMILTENIDATLIRAWMYRVAINEFYDLHRKQKRQADYLQRNFFEMSTTDNTEHFDILENLQRVFDRLPTSYQDLLLLKYYFGMSYQEIAEKLSLKPDSVKTKLYRARKAAQKINKGVENNEK